MRGWLAALRIARREARRAKGRSVLVIAMIAVPVLALSFAAVTYDMLHLTPEEKVRRNLGAADGFFTRTSSGPIEQSTDGVQYGSTTVGPMAPPADVGIATELPAGSRAIPVYSGTIQVRTPDGVTGVIAHGMDVADPLFAGRAYLVAGRGPARSGEVAVTEKARGYLGTRIGGTVELADGSRRYTIVGIVEFPDALGRDMVFNPDDVPPGLQHSGWLVDTPAPVTWSDVKLYNAAGIRVVSRHVLLHRPPTTEEYPAHSVQSNPPREELSVAVLVCGLAVLEVILLAGPAFAVSARRRSRQLALVAANGGTPAHIRRIVIADGVVLGVVAAGAGVALGIAAAFVARPAVEWHLAHARAGGYRVFPLALLAIAGLAVVTGVLGALIPAFTASRQDVVATLAGRRGATRSRKRWLVLGLAMCAAGTAIAGYGAWTVSVDTVLGGLVVGELGLVLCTPALVGLIAKLGRFLPVAPRMALRDTARNRAAAAPAISAVMAAVAGAVAIGVYLGSSQARQDTEYVPTVPRGYVSAGFHGDGPPPREAIHAAVREIMPVGTMIDVYQYRCTDGSSCRLAIDLPAANRCPYWQKTQLSRTDQRAAKRDHRCGNVQVPFGAFSSIVDDGSSLPLLTGASPAQVAQAVAVLRAGGIVVGSDLLVVDGRAMVTAGAGAEPAPRELTVAAHVLAVPGRVIPIIYSPGFVDRAGLGTAWAGVIASTTRMPAEADEDRLRAAVQKHQDGWAIVERGRQRPPDVTLVILTIVAGVITLGAAGIATGLAAADGRADLSTLAAVGASPRLRRVLSLSQSGVIAGLGAILGAAAGLGAASAVLFALNQVYASTWPAPTPYPISVPWLSLGIVLVIVPAVAMLGAGLLTRSRLPIERRLAT